MRQVIYRPDRYVAETESSRLVVACDPKTSTYAVYPEDEETTMGRLPLDGDQALRLAAYILATHSEAAGSEDFEGIAFAPSTTSCGAEPMPTFTVRPSTLPSTETPAAAEAEDLGLLHPDQERRLTALREATEILAGPGRLTHDRLIEWAGWILNGDTPTN